MSYLSVNAPYPHNKSDSLSSQQSEYDNVPSSYRHEYKTKRATTTRNGSNHVNDKHHYEKPQVDHTKKWGSTLPFPVDDLEPPPDPPGVSFAKPPPVPAHKGTLAKPTPQPKLNPYLESSSKTSQQRSLATTPVQNSNISFPPTPLPQHKLSLQTSYSQSKKISYQATSPTNQQAAIPSNRRLSSSSNISLRSPQPTPRATSLSSQPTSRATSMSNLSSPQPSHRHSSLASQQYVLASQQSPFQQKSLGYTQLVDIPHQQQEYDQLDHRLQQQHKKQEEQQQRREQQKLLEEQNRKLQMQVESLKLENTKTETPMLENPKIEIPKTEISLEVNHKVENHVQESSNKLDNHIQGHNNKQDHHSSANNINGRSTTLQAAKLLNLQMIITSYSKCIRKNSVLETLL